MRRAPVAVAAVALAAATTFGVTALTDGGGTAPDAPASSDPNAQTPSKNTDPDEQLLRDQVRLQKELRDAAMRDLGERVDQESEALRRAQNDGP